LNFFNPYRVEKKKVKNPYILLEPLGVLEYHIRDPGRV